MYNLSTFIACVSDEVSADTSVCVIVSFDNMAGVGVCADVKNTNVVHP